MTARNKAGKLLHRASEVSSSWLAGISIDQASTVLREGGCDREADVLDRATDRVGVDWQALDRLAADLLWNDKIEVL